MDKMGNCVDCMRLMEDGENVEHEEVIVICYVMEFHEVIARKLGVT